jgi:hypothetical protein
VMTMPPHCCVIALRLSIYQWLVTPGLRWFPKTHLLWQYLPCPSPPCPYRLARPPACPAPHASLPCPALRCPGPLTGVIGDAGGDGLLAAGQQGDLVPSLDQHARQVEADEAGAAWGVRQGGQ